MMQRKKFVHGRSGLTVALALSLLACGSGSSGNRNADESPSPAPTPTPSPAPAPAPTAISELGLLLAGQTQATLTSRQVCINDHAMIDVLGPDLPDRPSDVTFTTYDPESGIAGHRLTVGDRLYYWLDWADWSGGNEFTADDLVQEGPPVATFENGDTFLQLPVRTDEVTLQHATFGVTRNEFGQICFFGAGLEESGSGGMSFDFAGYADGLAFIDGQTYRLFGSAVQFTEGFMGGRMLTIELSGFEGAFGDTLNGTPTVIGRIELANENYKIVGRGDLGAFAGKMDFQAVDSGQGVIGLFRLARDDGDVIFGSFALDAQ